jgi:hypothetical protein
MKSEPDDLNPQKSGPTHLSSEATPASALATFSYPKRLCKQQSGFDDKILMHIRVAR